MKIIYLTKVITPSHSITITLFIFYIILGVIILLLFYIIIDIGVSKFHSTQMNLLTLAVSIIVGVLATLIAWYNGVDDWTAGGSEYNVRIYLSKKGYSDEVIEEKISKFKELNIIS